MADHVFYQVINDSTNSLIKHCAPSQMLEQVCDFKSSENIAFKPFADKPLLAQVSSASTNMSSKTEPYQSSEKNFTQKMAVKCEVKTSGNTSCGQFAFQDPHAEIKGRLADLILEQRKIRPSVKFVKFSKKIKNVVSPPRKPL